MPTYDRSVGSAGGFNYGTSPSFALTATYDAAKFPALAAADVVKLLPIPAGTVVRYVKVDILKADTTASRTISVGDDAAAAQYAAAGLTVSTVGSSVALEDGTSKLTPAKFYAAAGSINFTAGSAISNAVIKLTAIVDRV